VVATGGRLTDVADAYLIDPTVAERIVVVSSLGKTTETGAAMANPNGEMDPWADVIVTSHLRYVQVSAFYDQLTDVPASRIHELPNHTFGAWIGNKSSGIWDLSEASDQVVVAAVSDPDFAVTVEKASVSTTLSSRQGPDLLNDPNGSVWLVREVRGAVATAAFWQLLTPL
jgi:inosine-uridine nucleoside N-ribohydrolase